jgi:hypothetical protein
MYCNCLKHNTSPYIKSVAFESENKKVWNIIRQKNRIYNGFIQHIYTWNEKTRIIHFFCKSKLWTYKELIILFSCKQSKTNYVQGYSFIAGNLGVKRTQKLCNVTENKAKGKSSVWGRSKAYLGLASQWLTLGQSGASVIIVALFRNLCQYLISNTIYLYWCCCLIVAS